MSGNNQQMTKDLADLTGANLLDHYLTSVKDQLKDVTDVKDQPDLYKKGKEELKKELGKLRKIIALLSADKSARKALIKRIKKVRDQLDEPFEYIPYTVTCIRNLEKALDYGVSATFGLKEDITNATLLSVLQKVQVLKNKTLIPQKYFDFLEKIKEESE